MSSGNIILFDQFGSEALSLPRVKRYILEKQPRQWRKSWLNMGQQDRQCIKGRCDDYMLQYSLGTGACRISSLNLDSGFKFPTHLSAEMI